MFALVCWGRVGLHTFDALKFHIRKRGRVSVTSIIQVIHCIGLRRRPAPTAADAFPKPLTVTPNFAQRFDGGQHRRLWCRFG
jgi:hypothetical protein